MTESYRVKVDRRTTIKWLAATMAAAGAGCATRDEFMGEEIPPRADIPTPGVASAPDALGYGKDPDLINPIVPWQKTMTAAQLDTTAALADIILPADEYSPAASEVGVPDFVDEWVSAPYPSQQQDRELIFAGLEWLERKSQQQFGVAFASAKPEQAGQLIDQLADPDAPNEQAAFFARFRYLIAGAYYTTEEGMADIGYIGNVPILGEYPGPSADAMEHLAGILKQLGL